MFTGIITHLGTIILRSGASDQRIRIASDIAHTSLKLGESVAINGACMTVVDKGADDAGDYFDVQVSAESLSKTAAKGWEIGAKLNLERALKMGDDISGHLVSGHVDGIAKIEKIEPAGDSYTLTFAAPIALKRFIAPKGSVTLDGVSLTVNEVSGNHFTVNIIPHTWQHTNFHELAAGAEVNLEIDLLARYVARLLETENPAK